MTGQFQYHEPKSHELINTQKNWIKGWLNEFEDVLQSPAFADPVDGYAKYVDPTSFARYDILAEIFMNPDGHKFSTFMHKDRGGRLKFVRL